VNVAMLIPKDKFQNNQLTTSEVTFILDDQLSFYNPKDCHQQTTFKGVFRL
jgi:hypothetical protein